MFIARLDLNFLHFGATNKNGQMNRSVLSVEQKIPILQESGLTQETFNTHERQFVDRGQ
jgi:hypothetical protein